jgi:hypothetical protein
LTADVARRRGELDAAEKLARERIARFENPQTYGARSERANALALLALVLADKGRFDEAWASIEEAKKTAFAPELVFHHLTAGRVEAYIRTCRDRSRPA